MSEATETRADAAAESPAFLRAVADFGGKRAISTSRPIYNAQGTKLLEGGVAIDQGLYDRLVSHRLSLPLDECLDAGAPFSAELLREAAEAAIARWPLFARMAPAGAARRELIDALAGVAVPKPVGLHLMLAREVRPALFVHSILMALLSAHLVRQRGASRAAVGHAAAAGLLHDLGMLHIDPDLLDSDDRLSGDRLKPVYVHPLTSSMLVDRFAEYPKEIVRAIAEHHERLDGSGYPRGLGGDAVSPLGRVVSLAEVVTAMFDGERRHPEQRVSLLLRINPRRYDARAVAEVHRLLAGVEPGPAEDIAAGESIARLLRLAGALGSWRTASAELDGALGSAHMALVRSMNEQNATLQRMLYDAGITAEQLALLADDSGAADAAWRVELWALAEELLWQLHAAANQLKRRWQAAEPSTAYPAALAAWFGAVEALDS
jgi:HD-GYP domain-containing protein (c-di-GMP phosphodiesterase class II)